jgi:tetratricopeptide (TPR) repeat protein
MVFSVARKRGYYDDGDKMRPRIWCLFTCLMLSFSLLANAQELASTLYDQGKYQEALEVLEKNGLRSAADYYNAGNCHFRLGKLGRALAYFEKADAMAPGNEDIRYNLRFVEASLEKTGALARNLSFWSSRVIPFVRGVPEPFFDLLLALATSALAWISYRAKRQGLRFRQAFSHPAFLTVLSIWALTGALTSLAMMAHGVQYAAVVADSGVARSGPSETFTELFKIPAGSKVELTGESREGWAQVRFSLGNVGWIMEKDLLTL